MSLPASFRSFRWGSGGFGGELTPLNCQRQFELFIYLNCPGNRIGVPLPAAGAIFGQLCSGPLGDTPKR
jgi:hypothetical protein